MSCKYREKQKTWKDKSRQLWSNILNVNDSKKIDNTSAIIIETTYFLDVFEFEKENSHEHNYFPGWTCNKSGSLIILIPAKLGDFGLWNFCSSSLMALIRGVATSWAPAPRTASVAWSWIRTCITVIQNLKKSFGNYLGKAKTLFEFCIACMYGSFLKNHVQSLNCQIWSLRYARTC